MALFALLLKVLMHCTLMIAADGRKRLVYAVLNDIAIAATVGLTILATFLFNNMALFFMGGAEAGVDVGTGVGGTAGAIAGATVGIFGSIGGLALGIGGGIMCIIIAIFTTMYGVLSQFVLSVCSFVRVVSPTEDNPRGINLLVLLIALVSIAGAIIALILSINAITITPAT